MVESRSMVRGEPPGPAPAAQARASNWRLTRSNRRAWPQRKLRRKVPRVDGALTTQPRVQAVPPVRKTSASSMQSPPARACPRENGGPALPAALICPATRRPHGSGPRRRRISWPRTVGPPPTGRRTPL